MIVDRRRTRGTRGRTSATPPPPAPLLPPRRTASRRRNGRTPSPPRLRSDARRRSSNTPALRSRAPVTPRTPPGTAPVAPGVGRTATIGCGPCAWCRRIASQDGRADRETVRRVAMAEATEILMSTRFCRVGEQLDSPRDPTILERAVDRRIGRRRANVRHLLTGRAAAPSPCHPTHGDRRRKRKRPTVTRYRGARRSA